jgi:hypothetical protein
MAGRSVTDRSRRVVFKARVVRQKAGASTPLLAHLRYLQREVVAKEGELERMFNVDGRDSDTRAFSERCDGGRHHFSFIVQLFGSRLPNEGRTELLASEKVARRKASVYWAVSSQAALSKGSG